MAEQNNPDFAGLDPPKDYPDTAPPDQMFYPEKEYGSEAYVLLSPEQEAMANAYLGEEDRFVQGLFVLTHGSHFNSSNVQEIWYDLPSQSMYIKYQNGGTYRYWTVTEGEARLFFIAASKGETVWDVFRVRGSKTAHKKSYAKVAG